MYVHSVCDAWSTAVPGILDNSDFVLLQITKLKNLRMLCSERDPDVAITIRKVAMVSLMTVIKDIAPRLMCALVHKFDINLHCPDYSYRIRELSETEKAVKVCIPVFSL